MGNTLRISMYVTLGLGILVGVILVSTYLFGSLSMFTADFRGEVEERERVEASGAYRVASYDWYFDQCAAIQTKNENVQNLEDEMKLSSTSGERKAELQSAITATENSKSGLVEEYNANAAKEDTRGQFKDDNLPVRIDPNDEEVECS